MGKFRTIQIHNRKRGGEMRETKCGWCQKKAPIRRDDIRYVCLECTDFISFGRSIYFAIKNNEPLNAIDKEPINMQQIKDMVESMQDFRQKWANSEKLYLKEKKPEKKEVSK
jgi:hypothetical protein